MRSIVFHTYLLPSANGDGTYQPSSRKLTHWQAIAWPGEEPLFPRKRNEVFSAERFPELEKSALRLLQLFRRVIGFDHGHHLNRVKELVCGNLLRRGEVLGKCFEPLAEFPL